MSSWGEKDSVCGFEQSVLNGVDSIYCTGECEKMSEGTGRTNVCRQTAALEGVVEGRQLDVYAPS